jgi:hypothetical protein
MRSTFYPGCVARATQADVVREDHRAQNIVVPVYGVDTVENRNVQARVGGEALQPIIVIGPGFHAGAFFGIGIAAVQN